MELNRSCTASNDNFSNQLHVNSFFLIVIINNMKLSKMLKVPNKKSLLLSRWKELLLHIFMPKPKNS